MTDDDPAHPDRQRIDKWLWFARIVKTRGAAQELATSGHVRVNHDKNRAASRQVKAGDVLTIALGPHIRVLRVVDTGERRGPASEARRLFDDLTPAAQPRPGPAKDSGARPTKRDRRAWQEIDSA